MSCATPDTDENKSILINGQSFRLMVIGPRKNKFHWSEKLVNKIMSRPAIKSRSGLQKLYSFGNISKVTSEVCPLVTVTCFSRFPRTSCQAWTV